MYKEKIINYIEKSPGINFIITLQDEGNSLAMVNFVKDDGEYFAKTYRANKREDGKYDRGEFLYKDNINEMGEYSLQIFCEKWDQMVAKTLFNGKN